MKIIQVAVPWICLTACVNVDLESVIKQNDHKAQGHVRQINEAESTFFRTYGRFARLRELGPESAGLLDKNLAQGISDGYRFEVDVQSANYQVGARPLRFLATGWRSYYSDCSRIIRQSVNDSAATATSQELVLAH